MLRIKPTELMVKPFPIGSGKLKLLNSVRETVHFLVYHVACQGGDCLFESLHEQGGFSDAL